MARTVVRNSFARNTVVSARVNGSMVGCGWCGNKRETRGRSWLLRFHSEDDQGPRRSGPIAGGRLFCSRSCCETYIGCSLDETKG